MLKVLVVDSAELVRKLVCAGLGTIGVEGVQADPDEAIRMFEEGGFGLIICGRSLPTPQIGEALVLRLKAISPVPVLMLSGSDITTPPPGVDKLLPKPFVMLDFLETVKTMLRECPRRHQPLKFSHYGYPVYNAPRKPPMERCGDCNAEHSPTECCPA